jgi:hypothetical protein
LQSDGDRDDDEAKKEKGIGAEDLRGILAAGHGANAADKSAITTVVRSYFLAATAGDGAKGCSLLASNLATAVAAEENQPTATGNKSTCATSLTQFFKEQHERLVAEDVKTMVFTGVHVEGDFGSVTLGFKAMPQTEMVLQREGHTWKIAALFDSPLP